MHSGTAVRPSKLNTNMHISPCATKVRVVFNIHPYYAELSVDRPLDLIVAQDVVKAAYEYLESIHRWNQEFPDAAEFEKKKGSLIILRHISSSHDAYILSSTSSAHDWYMNTGHSCSSTSVRNGVPLQTEKKNMLVSGAEVRLYILLSKQFLPSNRDVPDWIQPDIYHVSARRKAYLADVVDRLSSKNRFNRLHTLVPSKVSKAPKLFDEMQRSSTPVRLGIRPQTSFGIHPTVFSGVFAKAHHDLRHLNDVKIELSDRPMVRDNFDMLTWSDDFGATVCASHGTELALGTAAVKLLRILLPFCNITERHNVDDSTGRTTTQIDWRGTCKTAHGLSAVPVLGEMKIGDGEGGNGLVQIAYSLQRMFAIHEKEFSCVLAFTCCPLVAISISGARMHVWLMYFTDQIYGTELFSIHMGGHDHQDTEEETRQLMAKFQILRNTVKGLCEFYANIHGGTMLPGFPHLFPQPASWLEHIPLICDDNVEEKDEPYTADSLAKLNLVIYDHVRQDAVSRRCVFRGMARPDPTEPHVRVFVKFVASTYGVLPHKLLMDHGYAPKLLWHGTVVGNRKMVVIEAVFRARDPEHQIQCDIALIETDIGAAVKLLHDNNYVHGDLRVPNMLIGGSRAYLIDFDWSGKAGEARYPRALNKDVKWPGPTDVLRRAVITKEQDIERFKQSLKELREPVKRALESTAGQDKGPTKKAKIFMPHALSQP